MLNWTNAGVTGMLPLIIINWDERASEQLNKRYGHGGGYSPSRQNWSFVDAASDAMGNDGKFKMLVWRPKDADESEDAPEYYHEWSRAETGLENIYLMDSSWLVIVDKATGEFTVTRAD